MLNDTLQENSNTAPQDTQVPVTNEPVQNTVVPVEQDTGSNQVVPPVIEEPEKTPIDPVTQSKIDRVSEATNRKLANKGIDPNNPVVAGSAKVNRSVEIAKQMQAKDEELAKVEANLRQMNLYDKAKANINNLAGFTASVKEHMTPEQAKVAFNEINPVVLKEGLGQLRGRTATEVVDDSLKSVAKWFVNSAGMAGAIVKGITQGKEGALDVLSAANFASDEITKSQSPYLQSQYAKVNRAFNKSYNSNKRTALLSGTDDDFNQQFSSTVKEVFDTIGEAVDRPQVILDVAMQTVGDVFTGGLIAKGISKSLTRKAIDKLSKQALSKTPSLNKAGVDAYVANAMKGKLGVALEKKIALYGEGAVTAYNAFQEGSSAAGQSALEVMNMSFEELSKVSPAFQERVAEYKKKYGVEPSKTKLREIKLDIATEVGAKVFLIAAPLAGAISHLSGASKIDSAIFTKTGSGSVARIGTSLVKEGVEETLDSASSDLTGNAVIKNIANKNKDITEGVGLDVGLGALAGGAVGGAIQVRPIKTPIDAAKLGILATTGIAVGGAKLLGVGKSKVKEATAEEIQNPNNFNYSSEEEYGEAIKQSQEKLATNFKRLEELDQIPLDERTPEQQAELSKLKEEYKVQETTQEELVSEYQAFVDSNKAKTPEEVKETVDKAIETADDKVTGSIHRQKAIDTIVNNADSVSDDQLDSLINATNTTEQEKILLNSIKEIKGLAGKSGKTMEQVTNEIHALDSNGRKMSLPQYTKAISLSVQNGDTAQTRKLLSALSIFKNGMEKKNRILNNLLSVIGDVPPDTKVNELPDDPKLVAALKEASPYYEAGEKYSESTVGHIQDLVNRVSYDSSVVTATHKTMVAYSKVGNPLVRKTIIKENTANKNSVTASTMKTVANATKEIDTTIAAINKSKPFGSLSSKIGNTVKATVVAMLKRPLRNNAVVTNLQEVADRVLLNTLNRLKTTDDKASLNEDFLNHINNLFSNIAKTEGKEFTPYTMDSPRVVELNSKTGKETNTELNKVRKEAKTTTKKEDKPLTLEDIENDTSENTPDEKIAPKKPVVAEKATSSEPKKVTETSNEDPLDIFGSDDEKQTTIDDLIAEQAEVPVESESEEVKQYSLSEALDLLKEGLANSKYYTALHKIIEPFVKNVKVVFVSADGKGLPDGATMQEVFTNDLSSPAAYSDGVIYFNSEIPKAFNLLNLMHELIHGATSQAINDVKNNASTVTTAQKEAVATLSKLFNKLAKEHKAERKNGVVHHSQVDYAFTDLHEFLAVSLSSNAMITWLKSKEGLDLGDAKETAYTRFINTVKKILGIDNSNAFTDTLKVFNAVMTKGLVSPTKETPVEKAIEPAIEDNGYAELNTEQGIKYKENAKKSIFDTLSNIFDADNNSYLSAIRNFIKGNLSLEEEKKLTEYREYLSNIKHLVSDNLGDLSKIPVTDASKLRNPLILLLGSNGKLLPRVVDSIAHTSMMFLISNVDTLLNPDDENLQKALNMQDDPRGYRAAKDYFLSKGLPTSYIADQLGLAILRNLNLDVDLDADIHLKDNLIEALGLLGVNLLTNIDTGDGVYALKPEVIDTSEVNDIFKEKEITSDFTTKYPNNVPTLIPSFIPETMHSRFRKTLPTEKLGNLVTNFISHLSLFNKIFSPDNTNYTTQVYEKPTEADIPDTINKSANQVSPQQKKAIDSLNKRPNTVRVGFYNLLKRLGNKRLRELLEYASEDQIKQTQVNLQDSLVGKNISIDRELDALTAMFEELGGDLSKPMYFLHKVGKLLRMDLQSRGVNPQQSILHRHMVQSKEINDVTLDIDPSIAMTPKEQVAYLAIATALDIKVENQSIAKTIEEVDAIYENNKEIFDGMLTSNTDAQKDAEVALAKSFGSKYIYALDGMHHLAMYKQAKNSGEKVSIPFQLFLEVDGKTNGVAISQILFGLSSDPEETKTMLNKIGMVYEGDNATSFADLVASDAVGADNYVGYAKAYLEGIFESFAASNIETSVSNAIPEVQKFAFAELFSQFFETDEAGKLIIDDETGEPIINDKSIRGFGKIGLIPANYGSASRSQANLIIDNLIKAYAQKVTDLSKVIKNNPQDSNEHITAKQELVDLVNNMGILRFNFKGKRNEGKSALYALATALEKSKGRMTNQVVNQILKTNIYFNTDNTNNNPFFAALVDGADKGLSVQQGRVLPHRKIIMAQSQIIVDLYNAAKKSLINDAILNSENGSITVKDVRDIENKLDKLFPSFHNVFSKVNNNIRQGTPFYKFNRKANNSPESRVEIPLKSVARKGKNGTEFKEKQNVSAYSHVAEKEASNLTAFMANVIGTDAVTMALYQVAFPETGGLNIFDAITLSLDSALGNNVKGINKIFLEQVKNFDAFQMTTDKMNEAITGFYENAFSYNEMPQEILPSPQKLGYFIEDIRGIITLPEGMDAKDYLISLDILTPDGKRYTSEAVENYIALMQDVSARAAEANTKNRKEAFDKIIGGNQYASATDGYSANADNTSLDKELGYVQKEQEEIASNEDGNVTYSHLGLINKLAKSDKQLAAKKEAISNLRKEVAQKRLDALKAKFNRTKNINDNIHRQQPTLEDGVVDAVIGSSIENGTFGQVHNAPAKIADGSKYDDISNENLLETFDKLEKLNVVEITKEHSKNLRNVLDTIVRKVMNPIKLQLNMNADTNKGYLDTTLNKLFMDVQQAVPHSERSKLLAGMNGSLQENMTHELVYALVQDGIANEPVIKKELFKLFQETKGQFAVEDFLPQGVDKNTPNYDMLYAAAKRQYIKAFNPSSSVKKEETINPITGEKQSILQHNSLSHFATLVLTNERIGNKAKGIMLAGSKPKGLFDTLANFFNRIVNNIYALMRGASPESLIPEKNAYTRMTQLMKTLSDIEYDTKKVRASDDNSFITGIPSKLTKIAEALQEKLKQGIKNSSAPLVKAITKHADMDSSNTVESLLVNLNQYRLARDNTKQGILGDTISEIFGINNVNKNIVDLFTRLKTRIDKERFHISAAIKSFVKDSFKNSLTSEQQKALTKTLINTNISTLFGRASKSDLNELKELLDDNSKLDNEITKLQNEINNIPAAKRNNFNHYLTRMARSLGSLMINNMPTEKVIAYNAQSIITKSEVSLDFDTQNRIEKLLNKLATLEALRFVESKHKAELSKLIESDYKGVSKSIQLVREFEKSSAKDNFENAEHLIHKGYSKDIYNPNTSIEIASYSDGEHLAKFGYERGEEVKVNSAYGLSTSKKMFIYRNPYAGKAKIVSGLFFFEDTKAAGLDLTSILYNSNLNRNGNVADDINEKIAQENSAIFNPVTQPNEPLEGILSVNPITKQYNYLIPTAIKDNLLGRNTNFSDVISAMYADINTKKTSYAGNIESVNTLRNAYSNATVEEKKTFVEISPFSRDNDLKEMWNRLPKELKDNITAANPMRAYGNGRYSSSYIMVPKDSLNIVMGYQLPSIDNIWNIPEREQKMHHKVIITLAEGMLGNRAPMHLRTLQELLEFLTRHAKTNILVRGLLVTAMNYLSNVNTLRIAGVPFDKIIAGHIEAFKAAKEYQSISKQLYRAKLISKTQGSNEKLNNEIIVLQDMLDNSPIKELVDAGMLQTIVEDISAEDHTKYDTYIATAIGNITDRAAKYIPEPVKKVGREALFLEGSTMFEATNDLVHVSDFAARYVLYKNYMSEGKDPKDSFRNVMEMFVHYDLPTNRYVQYGNNVGFLWYTRFITRNIKASLMLIRDNPERVLVYQMAQMFGVPFLDNILDSNIGVDAILRRIGFAPTRFIDSIGEVPALSIASNIN